ncbi:uncharacterized protein B4U79_11761, partial [Dinothrombium tinctorium]
MICVYEHINETYNPTYDIEQYMIKIKGDLKCAFKKFRKKHGYMKIRVMLACSFEKLDGKVNFVFATRTQTLLIGSSINEFIRDQIEEFLQRLDSLEAMAKYKPLRGGSYIDLPLFIKIKKAVVNVKNKDDKCFAYALLSALYPAEDNVERPIKYKDYMDK